MSLTLFEYLTRRRRGTVRLTEMPVTQTEKSSLSEAMWIHGGARSDIHVAFRGRFSLATAATVEIRVLTGGPFLLWLDGEWIGEGPVRWPKAAPEYQSFQIPLKPGSHVVALHSHHEGVATRLMEVVSPFVACEVLNGKENLAITWLGKLLEGYVREVRRMSPQFGWIDWCDSNGNPSLWHMPTYNDDEWTKPDDFNLPVAEPVETAIQLQRPNPLPIKHIADGLFTEAFGYQADDPPVRFFLRDLQALHGPPQGVWRRYDLGRVRLGRPRITLDLPRGSVVEIALSEDLASGRVNPWITLSGGASCNLDHFVAHGGKQEFMPHSPKGGRYLEVHVLAKADVVRFLAEEFVERAYHSDPVGQFRSSDSRLDRIWTAGVDTYRACAEDAVIDNPTRERGEWIGDSLTVGMESASVAYGDLGLFRQVLRHSARSSREDGLVAGLCPGTPAYLSTFACHWVSGGVRYWELTGDKGLLKELFPAAQRNLKAFSSKLGSEGLPSDLGWAFIDWGYVENDGPSDMGLNLIYLGALRSMVRWCEALGEDAQPYIHDMEKVEAILRAYLAHETVKPNPWQVIGLQRSVLAARAGLLTPNQLKTCVAFVKAHYLSCFPNDSFAPRLSDPGTAQARLITPFFSHFALPILWENGESDFVLDQYRTCWGWALDQGLTTWPEVFDLRWSHCHEWSNCPTWQLSRYVLGLWPRQDLGDSTFEFAPRTVSLTHASGKIPIPGKSGWVGVTYSHEGEKRTWVFESDSSVRLKIGSEMHEFKGRFEHTAT